LQHLKNFVMRMFVVSFTCGEFPVRPRHFVPLINSTENPETAPLKTQKQPRQVSHGTRVAGPRSLMSQYL
jgi:hypothetical protein